METKVDPRITEFHDSFQAGIDYARPYFEQYYRLYKLWKVHRFDELKATFSKINLGLFHAAVQDRLPKIFENVFATNQFVSLVANNPVAEMARAGAQTWLLSTLRDKLRIQSEIMPTLQTALIGGTAYRMPHVTYKPDVNGKWRKEIGSRDIEFFNVIPAPGGGQVNTFDNHSGRAVPWVMIVDWWTETKIREMAKAGVLEKEGVRRLLDRKPDDHFEEDQYRDAYSTVGNIQYTGPDQLRRENTENNPKGAQRRIVHWIRRDRHLIIGEDWVVLYDGKNEAGTIPLAKYLVCPDANNWFGISYLQIQEDLLKAIILNFNYRMDNLIGTMFPTTWIRKDIADSMKYKESDFMPKPYDVKFYHAKDAKIRDMIWVDRREDVTPQSFMDEDRMKALLQKIAGQTETTQSLGNVIGNKTATGVTSILAELAGRPNMESTILEYTGLREECMLLMSLAKRHLGDMQQVRRTDSQDGFPWVTIDPDDLQQDFSVLTNGTRYLTEKNQNFQKLLAMYPMWNNNPAWDQYELNRQAAMVADVLPEADKALLPPQNQMMQMAGMAGGEAARPGGMASAQDLNQQIDSVANRSAPEPGTGRQRRALEVAE
jgi:hypothetical protein